MIQKWAFHVCVVLVLRLGKHRDVLERLSGSLDPAYCCELFLGYLMFDDYVRFCQSRSNLDRASNFKAGNSLLIGLLQTI
jgi:hypothetical protein